MLFQEIDVVVCVDQSDYQCVQIVWFVLDELADGIVGCIDDRAKSIYAFNMVRMAYEHQDDEGWQSWKKCRSHSRIQL